LFIKEKLYELFPLANICIVLEEGFFMKNVKKQPHKLSLVELLQEVENRISTESVPTDQQQYITQTIIQILQAHAKRVEHPFITQGIQKIRGQAHVKRALEVSAAGQHNILLIGPPGAGKALLARTLPSLLPIPSLPYPFREPPSDIGRDSFLGDADLPGELILAHALCAN
jgi:ATP-dependent protease Clp ATPase subunit